jgi:hypothetical protein
MRQHIFLIHFIMPYTTFISTIVYLNLALEAPGGQMPARVLIKSEKSQKTMPRDLSGQILVKFLTRAAHLALARS